MKTIFACLAAAWLSSSALAAAVCAVPAPEPPARAAPDGQPLSAKGFAAWKSDFRGRALAAGIRSAIFDKAMGPVAFKAKIVKTAANASERTQRIWDYLDRRITPDNVAAGRRARADYAKILDRLSKTSGVPPEIILAFWGIETAYGRNMGQEDAFQAMASLAYEGGRRAFYEDNLIAAMRLMQERGFDRSQIFGSWAGALGHAQFMPESYLRLGVDGDGDGIVDLWNSVADAFASKANYMLRSDPSKPWAAGEPWLVEVQPPAGFDFGQSDMMIKKSVAEWEAMGVRLTDGRAPSSLKGVSADALASVFAPGGKMGPTVMTFRNFDRFWDYNPSQSYALAVAFWANAIAGRADLVTPWPREEPDVTRAQIYALQKRLKELGYSQDEPDGDAGRNTRAAIRAFQADHGMVADGFPSCALIERVLAR